MFMAPQASKILTDEEGLVTGTEYRYEAIDQDQREAIEEHVPGAEIREDGESMVVFVPTKG